MQGQTKERIMLAGKVLPNQEAELMLTASGYQLLSFDNAHAAIGEVIEDPPDFLVLEKGYENGGDLHVMNAVKGCLQKTNIPILLVVASDDVVSLDWSIYPVDDILVEHVPSALFLARLGLAKARMARVFDNNPLSRLPGNTSILRTIQDVIEKDEGYGVCYVDIDNFKPYNDRYGFSQGDDVILMVARIMVNVVEENSRDNSFVGHVGGDDFLFIVPEEKVKITCEKLLANFEVVRKMFLSAEDLKAGCYIEEDRQGRE
ncbi:MAG: diguanylate cyclase, partial [Spirochaetales bacterium]|nr:diguanylate cyclase [Spirochaetales bacterium]